MTNNDKIATSVAFTWHPDREVMGIWIACYKKDKPYEVAKNYRNWPGHTAFFSIGEIKEFWKISESSAPQERENINRGLLSLTDYIRRAPEKFDPAFR